MRARKGFHALNLGNGTKNHLILNKMTLSTCCFPDLIFFSTKFLRFATFFLFEEVKFYIILLLIFYQHFHPLLHKFILIWKVISLQCIFSLSRRQCYKQNLVFQKFVLLLKLFVGELHTN